MNDLAGQRILVTGGSGFVGQAMVSALSGDGAEVVVADREPHPDPGQRTVIGDLCRPEVREQAFAGGLDGVIHLAAATSVLRSIEDPAGVHAANVEMTAGLLELCRRHDVGRFLFASTNAVVGDIGQSVIQEDLPLVPLTPYGATKAAAEMLVSGYAASYGIAGATLRLSNVYGPGMGHKDSFVPRLMRAAVAGEGVHVYGDGTQLRDFVHVGDVVDAFRLAWSTRHTGRFIVGSGHSVTVNELVDTTRRVTGAAIPVEFVPPKHGEMPAVIVDITRARQLGWKPAYSLADGLLTVWRDFQSHG